MLERVTLLRAGTTGSNIIYTSDETGFIDGDIVSVALDNGFLYRTRIANIGKIDTSVGVAPFLIDDPSGRIDSHILRLTEPLPYGASVGNFVIKDTSAGDVFTPEEWARARKIDAHNRRALAARNAAIKAQQRRLEKKIDRFATRIEEAYRQEIERAKARQAQLEREEAEQRRLHLAEIHRQEEEIRWARSPEGRADRKMQFTDLEKRSARLAEGVDSEPKAKPSAALAAHFAEPSGSATPGLAEHFATPPRIAAPLEAHFRQLARPEKRSAQLAKGLIPLPEPSAALQKHFLAPGKKPSALETHYARKPRSKASVLGAHFGKRPNPMAALQAHFR